MKSISTLLFFFLILCPCLALAKNKVVAYVEHSPPLILVKDNHISGATVDFLNQSLSNTDIIVIFEEINWARAYLEAQQQPNIILTGLNRTPDREKQFHWLLKLPMDQNSHNVFFWQRADSPLKSQKNKLKNARIAVVLDDHKVEYLKDYIENLDHAPSIYTVGSREQAIHMLFKRRVDYILGGAMTKAWKVKALGYDIGQLERGPLLPNSNKGLYIALSKHTDITLVNKIQQALKSNVVNGRMKEAIIKWEKRLSEKKQPNVER